MNRYFAIQQAERTADIYIFGDIHEDQCMLIFIHPETRDLFVYYFTEYTIHCNLPPYVIVRQIQVCLTAL